ncbi:MAG: hypothetical protein GYA24_10485 [Candidatus Lokiarchaeota archaeon]|nr:hypothetical protein [Candidatus Lokiarchaeota archaeon]
MVDHIRECTMWIHHFNATYKEKVTIIDGQPRPRVRPSMLARDRRIIETGCGLAIKK